MEPVPRAVPRCRRFQAQTHQFQSRAHASRLAAVGAFTGRHLNRTIRWPRLGVVIRGRVICAAGLGLLCATLMAGVAVETSQGQPGKRDRARDCTTESMLLRGAPSVIRYVMWCGVQPGRVSLTIRRPQGPDVIGFSPIAKATGSGAAGPLRCRENSPGRVSCLGRTRGPATYRGTITVAPGTRCGSKISLTVSSWTGGTLNFPSGCPKSYEEPVRRLGQIIRSRADMGLDLDLAGDRGAISRRAKGLLAAWRRGDPVARWTSLEEAFRMPLRAFEQTELEYRDVYRERFQDLVEAGDWVEKNAPDTYAGYELDYAAGGIIYVGFTADQDAYLAKLRKRLIAPERFQPFPVPPTYTEAELYRIEAQFVEDESNWNLANMVSIDFLANKVEVGTQHVARMRRQIAARYGPDAPFLVVFARPARFL